MTAKLKLEVVRRPLAPQLVAEQILEHVRRGTLKPGDQLPTEKELMRQLGVGRSSVREGLQILATLNLIDSRPGAGTYIRRPNSSDELQLDVLGALMSNAHALELLEARQMIEPAVLRLACIRTTDADLDRLDALLDEHARRLQRGEPAHELAARFHVLLAEMSHNHIAVRFMQSIMGLLSARGRPVDQIPEVAQEEIAQHREIARLVRARDPEAASAAIVRHILHSAHIYDVELASLSTIAPSAKTAHAV
jgi:GntR family transcriptional repressor for pyruvate dehydrogenase complex